MPFQTHTVPFLIYTVLFLTYTVPFQYQNVMVLSLGTILRYTAPCLDTVLRWYRTVPKCYGTACLTNMVLS